MQKWNNRCKHESGTIDANRESSKMLPNQKDAHLYVRTCMRTLIMKFTANEMH